MPAEGRGLGSRPTYEAATAGRLAMSLLPPPQVGKLQETLHAKAKRAPDYRFYALYDKVYRADVLLYAYQCCRTNGGAPGVDGQTFEDIEDYGVLKWLGELAEELRGKTYRSQAGRQAAAVGYSDGQGPGRTDSCPGGLGADLRGRPAAGAVRLPSRAQRPGGGPAGPGPGDRGAWRGDRRGPERVFRQHPPRRVDEVGGATDQRPAPAASGQDVAGSTGRGDGRAGAAPSDHPQRGRGPGYAARRSALAAVEQ